MKDFTQPIKEWLLQEAKTGESKAEWGTHGRLRWPSTVLRVLKEYIHCDSAEISRALYPHPPICYVGSTKLSCPLIRSWGMYYQKFRKATQIPRLGI